MALVLGHIAMGLLFALPAWILWDGRTALAFIAFVLATVRLPDLDLTLQGLGFPVKHHGVLHTVVFVVGFSVIAGLVAVAVLRPILRRWWQISENEDVRIGTLYLFVTGGFTLGGLSHLFADVLAADFYEPVEPLWPIVEEPVALDVAYYTSPWLNVGLLIAAVTIHLVVVVAGTFPIEHRFRDWTREVSPDR